MIEGNKPRGRHIQKSKPNYMAWFGGILLGLAALSIGVFIGVGHGG